MDGRAALGKYEEALQIAQKLADPAAQADQLYQIGEIHYSLDEYEKALQAVPKNQRRIAEPRWRIEQSRYKREYSVGPVKADLRQRHGRHLSTITWAGPRGCST